MIIDNTDLFLFIKKVFLQQLIFLTAEYHMYVQVMPCVRRKFASHFPYHLGVIHLLECKGALTLSI